MGFGDTHLEAIEPGKHTIEGKNEIGGFTRMEIEVLEGHDVKVRVGAVPKGCFAVLMWVFPPAPTIVIEIVEN